MFHPLHIWINVVLNTSDQPSEFLFTRAALESALTTGTAIFQIRVCSSQCQIHTFSYDQILPNDTPKTQCGNSPRDAFSHRGDTTQGKTRTGCCVSWWCWLRHLSGTSGTNCSDSTCPVSTIQLSPLSPTQNTRAGYKIPPLPEEKLCYEKPTPL